VTYGRKERRSLSRRDLLKGFAAGAAVLAAGASGLNVLSPPGFRRGVLLSRPRAALAYQSPGGVVKKFIQPLRGVGPGGIPVAAPDAGPAPVTGVTHYSLDIKQYTDTLHPALGPTTLRGYNPVNPLGGGLQPQKHLGGIIVAQKGKPVQITFTNRLSGPYPLPFDTTIMGGDLDPNRACVHNHGGLVPWISDGGPHSWFGPSGEYGQSIPKSFYQILNPGIADGQAELYYPNNQSARMLWYHDHVWGFTRTNAYSGIASAYIIRDKFEGLLRNFGLPEFIENGGKFELPIVIQDKVFVGEDILDEDPTWPGPTTPGSLWYPHIYDADVGPSPLTIPDPSVVPEMFGDTMLANGLAYPEVTVEARRYRFRVLNACQARFLNLQLYVDDGSADGISLNSSLAPTNSKGPDFFVIGTEGGFLWAPTVVKSNVAFNPMTLKGSLITAPAERWDLIVDFRGFAGKKIILYNDAPAPFPMGDPTTDYFPGAPGNPTQPVPGYGPNTRQIMRFKVVPATSREPSFTLPQMGGQAGMGQGIDPLLASASGAVSAMGVAAMRRPGVKARQLTLNEDFDEYGRLIQMLGTNEQSMPGMYGRKYSDPTTETPRAGAVEVWQIANLTGDTHPIHFHLVNCQVLSRQPFDVESYKGTPTYTGSARGPEPTEIGWKETVKMHPGEVTTVIMKFDLAKVPFSVPASPRTGGNEFVWHCHILEHEEHDMMRPLVVT